MKLQLLALIVIISNTISLTLQAIAPQLLVENDTKNYIFVAPVCKKANANYRQFYWYAPEGENRIPLYAIAPGKSMQIKADKSRSTAFLDCVLWVSASLPPLVQSIQNSSRKAGVVSLYPAGHQSVFVGSDNEKLILARSQETALQKTQIDTDQLETLSRLSENQEWPSLDKINEELFNEYDKKIAELAQEADKILYKPYRISSGNLYLERSL